jgi:tetratricopeptide (TPR) repeat protein
MSYQAQQFVEAKQWSQAKPLLQKIVDSYPDFTGSDSAYRLLAAAHRALGETNAERQVLARFAAQDDKAPDAYRRLMELSLETHDWAEVIQNAQRYLAVDPLVPPPYRSMAQACEQSGQLPAAISAYRALLALDPPDPAEVHFRLAKALHQVGDPEAKRQVLQALEEAPRFREALQLLLEMDNRQSSTTTPRALNL